MARHYTDFNFFAQGRISQGERGGFCEQMLKESPIIAGISRACLGNIRRVRFSERCLGATVLRLHEGLWGLGAAAFAEANPTREPRTLNFRPRIMGFRIAGRAAPMDPRGCQ